MSVSLDDVMKSAEKNQEYVARTLEKLFVAAQPGTVYSPPVVSGNYTVITASEVMAGGGFGIATGFGGASSTTPNSGEQNASAQSAQPSGGGGGGGGGGSSARPVAVIVVGPDGVDVKPILDISKLAIAGITTWGAMLMVLRQIAKRRRR